MVLHSFSKMCRGDVFGLDEVLVVIFMVVVPLTGEDKYIRRTDRRHG